MNMLKNFAQVSSMSSISRILICRIILFTTFLLGLVVLGLWGGTLSKEVWNRHHNFPAVVLFFNPNDAELAVDIGYHLYNTFGEGAYDLDRAERYVQKGLEIDPMVPTAWHQLARIDFLRGDLRGAIAKADTQIALHGDAYMPTYYVRGLAYAFNGQLAQGEEDFKKFLAWKPESWAAHNDLAWIYFRQGKYEEMRTHTEAGISLVPRNPWLLMMHGVALMNTGERAEAAAYFARAQEEVEHVTPEVWMRMYPGNDPAIAEQGIRELKETIEMNSALVEETVP